MNKPEAIVCDLDGVLRNPTHRNEYAPKGFTEDFDAWLEHSRHVDKDSPIQLNIDWVNDCKAKGMKVILMTSASSDSDVVQKTLTWLQRHGVMFDKLICRAKGDNDSPAESKRNYLRMLADYYTLTMFLDDNLDNCRMAKEEGLIALHFSFDKWLENQI